MAGFEMLIAALCLNNTCLDPLADGFSNVENKTAVLKFDYDRELEFKTLVDQLNGKQLRVVSLEDYPLSYTEEINGTRYGRGVSFKILEFLTEKYNFSYELIMPQQNIIGSTSDLEGSILEVLKQDKADMAAAFLPMLWDVQGLIQYSSTTLDEGEWIMIMSRPAESATGSGLLAPFDAPVWILILVSLLAVGPIIYGLIILRYKLTKDKTQQTYPLPHCVWFVYGALMKQGSTLSPEADSTRLLFATWWIFITILTSFYTANLTAFLTLSKFTLPINSVDDLLRKDKNFVANRGGGVEYAIKNANEELGQLTQMVQKNRGTFTDILNDTDTLINMVEKKNYVFVRDKPASNHLLYADYRYRKTISMTDEKIQCPFAVAKNPLMKRKRTFAYAPTFKFSRLFDPALLSLVESGIIKYILLEGLPNAEICPQNLASTERQLRNGDLFTTYCVMLTGFCTSLVVFFTELFFKCLNNRRSSMFKQSMKRQQIRPSKFTNPSPPPPYTTIFDRSKNNFYSFNANMDEAAQKNINGRDYMVYRDPDGKSRLIPMRTPSAALFQYSYIK